jgi:hypothetical protein
MLQRRMPVSVVEIAGTEMPWKRAVNWIDATPRSVAMLWGIETDATFWRTEAVATFWRTEAVATFWRTEAVATFWRTEAVASVRHGRSNGATSVCCWHATRC